MKRLLKIFIPAVLLLVGLAIGLGIGQNQVANVKKQSQEKIKEVSKKVAFLQTRLAEEQSKPQGDPQCTADLEKSHKELTSARADLKKVKDQIPVLEAKIKDTEGTLAKTKNDFQALDLKHKQEIQRGKELETDLRKTVGEKLALEKDLKKTNGNLSQCEKDNLQLSSLADEILKKYQRKGMKAVLLQAEPLTQIKKVELEQLSQKYQDEIEKNKFQKR